MLTIITVGRKPLAGNTVAGNTLQYGCGGLNIDDTRIMAGGPVPLFHSDTTVRWGSDGVPPGVKVARTGESSSQGRWPANFILSHLPGCHPSGTTEVKGHTLTRWVDGAKPFGGGAGHPFTAEYQGPETVVLWECQDGCPIGDLDGQSGECTPGFSNGYAPVNMPSVGVIPLRRGTLIPRRDKGGASRFFKQVKEDPKP
jgi:hypothetical protein